MVSACKAITDAKLSDDGAISFINDYDSGFCWGAFALFQQAIRLTDGVHAKYTNGIHGKPLLGVCAPSESTRSQFVQLFVIYAKSHPERYHEDFFTVALDAATKAFPCRT